MTQRAEHAEGRPLGLLLALGFAVVVAIVGAWVVLFVRRGDPSPFDVLWSPALAVGFTTIGALIAARRPGHPVGRLCLAIGLVLGVQLALVAVIASFDVRPGRLPDWMFVLARITDGLQWLGLVGVVALLARFPDGRLPSARWRVVDLLLVGGAALLATSLFRPGELGVTWILQAANPIAILEIPTDAFDGASGLGATALIGALVLSIAALVVTYRRSAASGRAQIRWVLAAVVAASAGLGLLLVANWTDPFATIAFGLLLVAPILVPVGIGIAILRYRLYEIDRIVSRTIGYAAVTAVLAVTFLGANLVLQAVLGSIVRADTLAVAASTLFVAALFAPLRSRIQRVVDLRFHRARRDAEQTAARFADRLRDEVDLAALRVATLSAVDSAVEPAAAALWLRGRSPEA
jgi:hypothetical protein